MTTEPKTGYRIPPIGDEKHCSNCEHFVRREGGCNGPKMKALSQRPRFENGDVKVSLVAVCKFWEPR
jgi:hypothetical protein